MLILLLLLNNQEINLTILEMKIDALIQNYLNEFPDAKRAEMEELHQHIMQLLPDAPLWFLDGKDEKGKVVSNPNIGYGNRTIHYADGKTKAFFQIGISANTTGISVYVMGIADKLYLPNTFGKTIGKATVTGYCIKFKNLKDIKIEILDQAILDGVEKTKS